MEDVIEDVRIRLREKIKEEGEVLGKEFLKVDSFLNHKVAPSLLNDVGKAICEKFQKLGVTKVLTAEAAGNIIAYTTAANLNKEETNVEVVYAKKGVPSTMSGEEIRTIRSPTKKNKTTLAVSGDYFDQDDRVLIVDDFLFTGRTAGTLSEIMDALSVTVVGYGFVIRKLGSGGYERLSKEGKPIFSLIEIESMNPETGDISFSN
ncbi:xanthine phosphoribosyltransferase [Candidatus Bipolaricaulota bacterium]|nr:xanthine phosphoribosyltransferase [Candidatus Bipolaricaulota bacterium]